MPTHEERMDAIRRRKNREVREGQARRRKRGGRAAINREKRRLKLHRQKVRFLEALASTGNVTIAAKAAGWRNSGPVRRMREEDEAFADAWALAVSEAADGLEEAALKRAVEGTVEYQVHQGQVIYHQYPPGHPRAGEVMIDEDGHPIPLVKRRYSDKLLALMLKAKRPEEYGDKVKMEHEHKGGVLLIGADKPESGQKALTWEEELAAHQTKFSGREDAIEAEFVEID